MSSQSMFPADVLRRFPAGPVPLSQVPKRSLEQLEENQKMKVTTEDTKKNLREESLKKKEKETKKPSFFSKVRSYLIARDTKTSSSSFSSKSKGKTISEEKTKPANQTQSTNGKIPNGKPKDAASPEQQNKSSLKGKERAPPSPEGSPAKSVTFEDSNGTATNGILKNGTPGPSGTSSNTSVKTLLPEGQHRKLEEAREHGEPSSLERVHSTDSKKTYLPPTIDPATSTIIRSRAPPVLNCSPSSKSTIVPPELKVDTELAKACSGPPYEEQHQVYSTNDRIPDILRDNQFPNSHKGANGINGTNGELHTSISPSSSHYSEPGKEKNPPEEVDEKSDGTFVLANETYLPIIPRFVPEVET